MSEFLRGSTTASAIYVGLSGPDALAFDSSGNLYVANDGDNTVSKFAPGSTTAIATYSAGGSDLPMRPGVRLQRQPVRGQLGQQYGEQVRAG